MSQLLEMGDRGSALRGGRLHPGLVYRGVTSHAGFLPGLDWRMGRFLCPRSDQGHRVQSERNSTTERVRRIEAPGQREKKNDKELVKGQEINFFSPYRSISLEACKGQRCPFKVPPGFTS